MSTTSPSTTPSIALTAIFTPSPSCLSDYWLIDTASWLSLGPPSTSACLPSGWEVTSQHFSPGRCPSGYEIACSTLVSLGTLTETQATCCPSGYSCQLSNNLYFYSTEPCTVTASKLPSVLEVTTTNSSTTLVYPYTPCGFCGANAYGISIRFQSTDFATTTPSSTPASSPSPSPSSSPASSSSPSPSPVLSTSSPPPNSTSSQDGLSSGAKAGIGIGVAIAVLAMVAAIVYFVAQSRRRAIQPDPTSGTGIQELENRQVPMHPPELYGGENNMAKVSDQGREQPAFVIPQEPQAPVELYAREVPR